MGVYSAYLAYSALYPGMQVLNKCLIDGERKEGIWWEENILEGTCCSKEPL